MNSIENNKSFGPSSCSEFPQWLFLWLPIIMLITPYVLNGYFPVAADFYFEKESGVIENVTVFLLCIALLFSIRCVVYVNAKKNEGPIFKFLHIWLVLYTLGCIYYLGEEISWGQHLFDWATPDAWLKFNDQQETNLHNTLGIFDQLPRALVTLGIVIGGLIIPIYQRIKKIEFGQDVIQYWIFPTYSTMPTALAILVISLHDKPYELLNIPVPPILNFSDGEAKEALIALFILIYILSIFYRSRTIAFEREA